MAEHPLSQALNINFVLFSGVIKQISLDQHPEDARLDTCNIYMTHLERYVVKGQIKFKPVSMGCNCFGRMARGLFKSRKVGDQLCVQGRMRVSKRKEGRNIPELYIEKVWWDRTLYGETYGFDMNHFEVYEELPEDTVILL